MSSVLVAVTFTEPADPVAVNSPLESIVPPLAVHVTVELKLPVPFTVAAHCEVALIAIVDGLHATPTEEIVGEPVPVATVTVAFPDLLESSLLVAVTVTVAAELGAVSSPLPVIDPPLALHVTVELKLPVPSTLTLHCEVAPGVTEDGEHTTDTEEIVEEVVVPVPPTEPPPHPANGKDSNDAANNNPRRAFKYCLQSVCSPRSGLMRGDAGKTHGPQASTSLGDALPNDWGYIPVSRNHQE